jgi:hypothetical protein
MAVTRGAAVALALVLLLSLVLAEAEAPPTHRTLVELFTSQG